MKQEMTGWQWHQLHMEIIAPDSRQITKPAPHHSTFFRLDALPDTQLSAKVAKVKYYK